MPPASWTHTGHDRSPEPRRPGADDPVAPGHRDHRRPAGAGRTGTTVTFPRSSVLRDAGLATEHSTVDGRSHLVDDARLDAELAAVAAGRTAVPRIRALCTTPVVTGSLTVEPGPDCGRCLDVAAPRLAAAARERAARERAARPPGIVARCARRLRAQYAVRPCTGRHRA